MLDFYTGPRDSFGGYSTFPAVDSSHGVNQKNRNTPKWDILESSDRCVIVGRPLVRATATDRLGIDEAHLLFNAIQDSPQLNLDS